MRLIEVKDYRRKVYLIPFGDLHLGSPYIDAEKIDGYLEWIKKNKAYVFLMGDLFDIATLDSATEVWGQQMSINNAIKVLVEKFTPIKKQIIGAIIGNHEDRLIRYSNFNPVQTLCDMLEVPYCNYSAVLRFRVGGHTNSKLNIVSPTVEYVFYAHHTTGGGATIGGKLNRIVKLNAIFAGADAYLGGHNHAKALGEESVFYLSKNGRGEAKLLQKKVMYIDTGSFTTYENSYAEKQMLGPNHTGAVRIRMSGSRKDLHVSY